MKSLADCRLYTFVDSAYLRGRRPAEVAQKLCEGGSDLIQLRAKHLPREEIRRLAEAILPVTRRAGIGLVINDDLEVARELGADFCHLGQEDFFDPGHTRTSELVGAGEPLGIGLSTHTPDQAARALAANPAYLGIGPVYPTQTKPTAQAVTLEYVRWAAANVAIPWFAIGGINLENLDNVIAAGARMICVVSAILNSPDVASACKKFKSRLG